MVGECPLIPAAAPLPLPRFPFSRPELLKEWVLNIGRGDFEPKQHTVICSEHFRPECFSAFGNRKNLKHNAVPTEFAFQDARQVNAPPTTACGTPPAVGGTGWGFQGHPRPRAPRTALPLVRVTQAQEGEEPTVEVRAACLASGVGAQPTLMAMTFV